MEEGIPSSSVGFWTCNTTLTKVVEGKKIYYFTNNKSKARVRYVGLTPPQDKILSGTLVRVSLARWWIPQDSDYDEKRCYLQLSGWY